MAEMRGRLQAVDVYRGLAILAMVAYHTCWDLDYYGLIAVGIGIDPLWIGAQRGILTAFLLLVGASLALAHRDGIRWPQFWRREALLVGAALLVSLGTWFLFHDALAYFGVLHVIALASLLALPFVVLPLWSGILVAIVVLALPALYSSDLFDVRWLAWIGFFRTTPETADLVPVFPWLGVVLVGVLGMRLGQGAAAFTWRSGNPLAAALARIGRWSLVIYLVHQPVLFGLIMPFASYMQTAELARQTSFTQSCTAACASGGGDPGYCTAYCRCALDLTVRDNLWEAPKAQLEQVGRLCTAMGQ